MPYIEQDNVIRNREDFGIFNADSNGFIISEQNIQVMTCPTRGPRSWQASGTVRWAQGDYANPEGAYPNWRAPDRPSPGPNYNEEAIFTGLIARGGTVNAWASGGNETLAKYSRVNFGSCKDGSSNTLLLIEKSADQRFYSAVSTGPAWGTIGHTGGMMMP